MTWPLRQSTAGRGNGLSLLTARMLWAWCIPARCRTKLGPLVITVTSGKGGATSGAAFCLFYLTAAFIWIVLFAMTARCMDFKILNPIVQPIAVFVMNDFVIAEWPADVFRDEQPVQQNPSRGPSVRMVGAPYHSIALARGGFSVIPIRISLAGRSVSFDPASVRISADDAIVRGFTDRAERLPTPA